MATARCDCLPLRLASVAGGCGDLVRAAPQPRGWAPQLIGTGPQSDWTSSKAAAHNADDSAPPCEYMHFMGRLSQYFATGIPIAACLARGALLTAPCTAEDNQNEVTRSAESEIPPVVFASDQAGAGDLWLMDPEAAGRPA